MAARIRSASRAVFAERTVAADTPDHTEPVGQPVPRADRPPRPVLDGQASEVVLGLAEGALDQGIAADRPAGARVGEFVVVDAAS